MDNDFKKITDSLASLLEYKNRNYGGAYEDDDINKSINIFSGKCSSGEEIDNLLSVISYSDEIRIEDVTNILIETLNIFYENRWDCFKEFQD